MMSYRIESQSDLEQMFLTLRRLEDRALIHLIVQHGFQLSMAETMCRAFKAMVSVTPVMSQIGFHPVSNIGIIGADSVPTALWPYLILTFALGVPCKVKVPPADAPSLNALRDILLTAFAEDRGLHNRKQDGPWEQTTSRGDDLICGGYWDDCERLLVFGSDATVNHYANCYPMKGKVKGFGNVESILLVDRGRLYSDERWMADLLMFNHHGCLAPRMIVTTDGSNAADVAQGILTKLSGHVHQSMDRAISLRFMMNQFIVDGVPAWLSDDGMWLISTHLQSKDTGIPGLLTLVDPSIVQTAVKKFGSVSAPDKSDDYLPKLDRSQTDGVWKCEWGNAQLPTMSWCNGGFPILETLCR